MHEEGTGLMTQGPTYREPNSQQAPPKDTREKMSAMSVQSEPSRTKGLVPSLADTDARYSHMGSRL